jgi:hypothetical protein
MSNFFGLFKGTHGVEPVPVVDLEQDSQSDTPSDALPGSSLRRLASGSVALLALGLVVATGRSIAHPGSEQLPIAETPSIFSFIEMDSDMSGYFTRTSYECSAYLHKYMQKTTSALNGPPHPPCQSHLKSCTLTSAVNIRKGYKPMLFTKDPHVETVCVPYSCQANDLKADMTGVMKAQIGKLQSDSVTVVSFRDLDVSNCGGDSAKSDRIYFPGTVV